MYAWSHARSRGFCTVRRTSGGMAPPKRSFMNGMLIRFELRNVADAACVHCEPIRWRPTSNVVSAACARSGWVGGVGSGARGGHARETHLPDALFRVLPLLLLPRLREAQVKSSTKRVVFLVATLVAVRIPAGAQLEEGWGVAQRRLR